MSQTPSAALAFLGALILITKLASPAWADVQAKAPASAPDSLTLQTLQAKLARSSKVRVTTTSGVYEARTPRVSTEGLHLPELRDTSGARLEVPQILYWQDISRVEVRKSGAGKEALRGSLVFGALALFLGISATGPYEASASDVVIVTALGAGSGALLGAIIGGLSKHWKTEYTSSSVLGLPLTIRLEGGVDLEANSIEPWALAMVKVVETSGQTEYLSSNKIRAIMDGGGRDRTKEVLTRGERLQR